ncbi:MAG: protein-glutamate O-methyltransferase CheR [Alphaproteobacteria bacterium]
MRVTDFEIYRGMFREKSGLALEPDQSSLLDSRLTPVARKWGYSSLDALTASLHGLPDEKLVLDVVDAIMPGDTSFFRDTWPFHTFSKEILDFLRGARAKQKKIKIWCAGAATGQEPYSTCFAFKEHGTDFGGWKFEVLATDISRGALKLAEAGLYTQSETQRGLPARMLLKYFKQNDEGHWQVNSDIRKMIRFQSFNLLDNMAALGKFDVIFCRNVLSNFEGAAREKTLEKLSRQLEKDGFLVLGRGEKADEGLWRTVHEGRSIYALKDGPIKA